MSTDVKRSRIIVNLSRLFLNNNIDRSIDGDGPSWMDGWTIESGRECLGCRNRVRPSISAEIKFEERTLICRLQGPGNLPFAVTRPVQGSSSPVIARQVHLLRAPFSHFPPLSIFDTLLENLPVPFSFATSRRKRSVYDLILRKGYPFFFSYFSRSRHVIFAKKLRGDWDSKMNRWKKWRSEIWNNLSGTIALLSLYPR